MGALLKISEISQRDFINLRDGSRMGPVKDVHIDPESGKILALVLQGRKRFGLFGAADDLVIPWNSIKKIGVHAVLVDADWR
ncbi:MAG: YlmC/YmxH family sporulation protein [Bacillota bacterium]